MSDSTPLRASSLPQSLMYACQALIAPADDTHGDQSSCPSARLVAEYLHRSLVLLLLLEMQQLSGKLLVRAPSDGTGIEPYRTATEGCLNFHQEANRDEIARLRDL